VSVTVHPGLFTPPHPEYHPLIRLMMGWFGSAEFELVASTIAFNLRNVSSWFDVTEPYAGFPPGGVVA
jgi:hypothetical protein